MEVACFDVPKEDGRQESLSPRVYIYIYVPLDIKSLAQEWPVGGNDEYSKNGIPIRFEHAKSN